MRNVAISALVPRYDTAWKLYVETPDHVRYLIEIVDKELGNLLDWDRGVEYLDTELQQIAPRSVTGRQIVDKLIKVYLKNGKELWILIHIEIQSKPDPNFEERLYAYNAAIWLRYRRTVLTLAILADSSPKWRPSRYERGIGKSRVVFEFNTIKVLDLDETQLLEDGSPAGLILVAFKRAILTRRKQSLRLQARLELARLAIERGYNDQQVSEILGLLEWIMQLSEQMEQEFQQMLEQIKREHGIRVMPSFMERELRKQYVEGYEEGRAEGRAEGFNEGRAEGRAEGFNEGRIATLQTVILTSLQTLYGGVPASLIERIQKVRQYDLLLSLQQEALRSGSLDAFEQKLNALISGQEPS